MTSTSRKVNALQQILDNASPREKLRFAKLVRDAYVNEIADTKERLDPARLRALDANIKLIESTLN